MFNWLKNTFGWVDDTLKFGKYSSRTLLLMVTTTGLLWYDKVSENTWMMVALGYLGTTKAYDFAKAKWAPPK